MKQIFFIIATLAVAQWQTVSAQTDFKNRRIEHASAKTVITSANETYNKASRFKRFVFGEHYRQEWATPVEVQVLYLDVAHGGLTPVKMGGGLQTKSLRLTDKEGKEYVLRSVNKDPSKALPKELVGTFANDVVQDQISSSNPFAPVVVAALAEVAGIYHTMPSLYYVPEQTLLGEFNKAFANSLCLLEERPAGDQTKNPALDFADKVVNSEKMFERLFSDARHRMDEKSFLKARLFDMWIGDWDRHEDQWLWAAFRREGKTIYRPIPRDRDQAFAKLDGLVPQMAARKWAIRKTQNFDEHIRDVAGLNMNGILLDRKFTTQLSWQDWVAVTVQLQALLTNEAIEKAFLKMPEAVYTISGESLIDKLKKRRNDLLKYAGTYYSFLSKDVDVIGTSGQEFFEAMRIDDSTKITVRSNSGDVVFERIFLTSETKEIRLYGLEGDDRFVVNGKGSKGTLIRIIGGKGKDSVADDSQVKGWRHQTKIYDDGENIIAKGREAHSYISKDSLTNDYNRNAYAYDWLAPQMAPGYNPDDGLYIGGGVVFKKQQFGKAPFGQMHSLKANYAFATGAYNFWYEGIFKQAIDKWDLHLNAVINAPNYSFNYFGLGNETELYTKDRNYYRVRSNQIYLSPSLSRQFGKYHTVDFGLSYQSVEIEKNDNRFVADYHSRLDSTDFTKNYFGGAKLAYRLSTVDNVLYPHQGIRWNAVAEYIQNISETEKNFVRLSSDVTGYFSAGNFTAALRVGTATNMGDGYEFFQANNLGSTTNLRGFPQNRFAGETSFYQNTELRWKLKNARGYFLRGDWGLLGFLDNGRVWIPEEKSDMWHYGYGGGIWFLPYNKMAFTATYGVSKEEKRLSVKAGFLF